MVSPFSMDVTVGESIVLPCQVSHDHSLDIMFTWSFNGHLIDFEKDGDHFERVGGVSIKPDKVGHAEEVANRRNWRKAARKRREEMEFSAEVENWEGFCMLL